MRTVPETPGEEGRWGRITEAAQAVRGEVLQDVVMGAISDQIEVVELKFSNGKKLRLEFKGARAKGGYAQHR